MLCGVADVLWSLVRCGDVLCSGLGFDVYLFFKTFYSFIIKIRFEQGR